MINYSECFLYKYNLFYCIPIDRKWDASSPGVPFSAERRKEQSQKIKCGSVRRTQPFQRTSRGVPFTKDPNGCTAFRRLVALWGSLCSVGGRMGGIWLSLTLSVPATVYSVQHNVCFQSPCRLRYRSEEKHLLWEKVELEGKIALRTTLFHCVDMRGFTFPLWRWKP